MNQNDEYPNGNMAHFVCLLILPSLKIFFLTGQCREKKFYMYCALFLRGGKGRGGGSGEELKKNHSLVCLDLLATG